MEPITTIGFLMCAAFGISGWALLTTVKQGNQLAELRARMEDNSRRFDEIITRFDRLEANINKLFLHRRSNDHP